MFRSKEEQFDFYWKEIFTGLAYNPIEFNTYRFDQTMSLPGKVNKLYDMFKVLAMNNQEVMDYLKEFVETFDEKLYETLEDVLNVWLEDGRLADVVRVAISEEVIEARTDYLGKKYVNLKERLDSEKAEFKSDIVEVTAQLAQTNEQLAQIVVNIKTFGAVGDGVTDDSEAIKRAFTSGSHTLYIPEGTYIINITPGTTHDMRNFCGGCNVTNIIGVPNKSIIKLGQGNCDEQRYTGFQSLFQWRELPDTDITINGLTFDYNYSQNIGQHYLSQYASVEFNSQQYALSAYLVRDFTVTNCEFIDASGTNVIQYNPNTNNTRDSIVKIYNNVFSNIGHPFKFNGSDAFHDHSTLSIHNQDRDGYLFNMVSYIHNNVFKGVGGNAYNACECSADIQYFYENIIDGYYITNLICSSKKELVVYNYNNVGRNLVEGVGIFTYKSYSNTENVKEVAFKILNIYDNVYEINIDYHKNQPFWSSYTKNSDGYFNHFYTGILWGAKYRNIDTLSIKNNKIEYIQSYDVTSLTGDVYRGYAISFSNFSSSEVSTLTEIPYLKNLIIENNLFINCYKGVMKYSTYPNTTNISIRNNKIHKSTHDPLSNKYMFDIGLIGDDPSYPYATNPIIEAYVESIIFENNVIYDSNMKSLLVFRILNKTYNVSYSKFIFKNNKTMIPTTLNDFILDGVADEMAAFNVDSLSLTNLTDDKFDDGIYDHKVYGSAISLENSKLVLTDNLEEMEHYTSKNISKPPIPYHKYYLRCNVYQNGGKLTFLNKKSDGSFEQVASNAVISKGVASVIFNPTSVYPTPDFFYRVYGKSGVYVGNSTKYYFDKFVCVDLTEDFGVGYEPSKEWCDKYINVDNI